ncbi:hypothetical protein ACQP2E_13295 [Actinoplanes sp. CA-015351]|uniref:hypothetical protein n=1 Tax=Actinoplanes sp. CA-015351 TaxID=3239897 RepID=UPI003D985A91
MTSNDLKSLLEEASDTIQVPSLAHTAWSRARRTRQRRYGISVAAVAALTISAAFFPTASQNTPLPEPIATSLTPQVHRIPAGLPTRLIAPLPPRSADLIPGDVQPLSAYPIEAAMAVFQPTVPEPGAEPEPIYAVAPDGIWVELDVADLTFTHDEGGNRAAPLRPLSLSPDRRRIAIPQPQAVVVVDLPTATAHRIGVPGLNEQVAWQDDTTVLVGAGGPGAYAVGWAARKVTRLPAAVSLWDSDGSLLELPATGRTLRQWGPAQPSPVSETPVDDTGLPGYTITEWYGSPITNGDHVVRSSWGSTPTHGHEAVTVVNARTGVAERVLDLGPDRWKGCCAPLAFIDRDTVLIQAEREGLIAWNFRTGSTAVVTAGQISGILSVRLR